MSGGAYDPDAGGAQAAPVEAMSCSGYPKRDRQPGRQHPLSNAHDGMPFTVRRRTSEFRHARGDL